MIGASISPTSMNDLWLQAEMASLSQQVHDLQSDNARLVAEVDQLSGRHADPSEEVHIMTVLSNYRLHA